MFNAGVTGPTCLKGQVCVYCISRSILRLSGFTGSVMFVLTLAEEAFYVPTLTLDIRPEVGGRWQESILTVLVLFDLCTQQ